MLDVAQYRQQTPLGFCAETLMVSGMSGEMIAIDHPNNTRKRKGGKRDRSERRAIEMEPSQ